MAGTSCQGAATTITLTGSAAGLPKGNYTVTYNLTGVNSGTGITTGFTVSTAGTATFNTNTLATAGATNIQITNLSSGSTPCSSNISAGHTASFTVLPIPAQPGTITGSATPCVGSSQTYSVTNTAGINYAWSFPTGWTQTAGGTTRQHHSYSWQRFR
ncbi:hypothetical protein [Flavobacterium sp. 3HN19-14]|uniref:hypothetical protein n=1 Tax=Flavobacterium sp. 3HN19-14 TaxID=3448133 RepID=UPI003EE29834